MNQASLFGVADTSQSSDKVKADDAIAMLRMWHNSKVIRHPEYASAVEDCQRDIEKVYGRRWEP